MDPFVSPNLTAFAHNECFDPGIPVNGKRFGESFLVWKSISFACEDGFIRNEGPEVLTCVSLEDNVAWDGPRPK